MQSRRLLWVICYWAAISLHAQVSLEENYEPLPAYSAQSNQLIDDIRAHINEEFATETRLKNPDVIRKVNNARKDLLASNVKHGTFIQDEELENFFQNLVNKIAVAGKLDTTRQRIILISRSPEVNAVCFGRGIFVVTVGLLSRMTTEEELAFTLAHEMAHDELDHVKSKIIQQAELDLQQRSREQIARIMSGKIDIQDIEEFRRLIYGVSRYTREQELVADSMGLKLIGAAGYDRLEAVKAFAVLDEPYAPKYDAGEELLLPLHSADYPFQSSWLNDRLSIYHHQNEGDFMARRDSLESHPAIEARLRTLLKMEYPAVDSGRHFFSRERVLELSLIADFESVEAAYFQRKYDQCMFLALQLLNKYPHNSYLVSRIGRVLIDLAQANEEHTEWIYVPDFTFQYSEELRIVNNVLHNMTTRDFGEVAFHFLNNKQRFNPKDKNHWWLLWRACTLTYRDETSHKVRGEFQSRFGLKLTSYSYQ